MKMKIANMWCYNFSDYKKYCHLFGLKENNYKSLQDFKKYMIYQSEELLNGGGDE